MLGNGLQDVQQRTQRGGGAEDDRQRDQIRRVGRRATRIAPSATGSRMPWRRTVELSVTLGDASVERTAIPSTPESRHLGESVGLETCGHRATAGDPGIRAAIQARLDGYRLLGHIRGSGPAARKQPTARTLTNTVWRITWSGPPAMTPGRVPAGGEKQDRKEGAPGPEDRVCRTAPAPRGTTALIA